MKQSQAQTTVRSLAAASHVKDLAATAQAIASYTENLEASSFVLEGFDDLDVDQVSAVLA